MHLFACLAAGVVSVLWLFAYDQMHSYFFGWKDFAIHLVGGLLLLLVWTFMRTTQIEFIARLKNVFSTNIDKQVFCANGLKTSEESEVSTEPKNLWKRDTKIKVSFLNCIRSFIPLGIGWIIAFSLIALPILFNLHIAICITCTAIACILPFPVTGMMQSYMESENTKIPAGLTKGFTLNKRYCGSFIAMWIFSVIILALVCFALMFGEIIIAYLFVNKDLSIVLEEQFEIPAYVYILKYAIVFIGTVVLSYLTPAWTLPQQIHIKAILVKEQLRKVRKAEKKHAKEKKATTSFDIPSPKTPTNIFANKD